MTQITIWPLIVVFSTLFVVGVVVILAIVISNLKKKKVEPKVRPNPFPYRSGS